MLCVTVMASFLLLYWFSLYEYSTMGFVPSTIDKGSLQFLALRNKAAVNISVDRPGTHKHTFL